MAVPEEFVNNEAIFTVKPSLAPKREVSFCGFEYVDEERDFGDYYYDEVDKEYKIANEETRNIYEHGPEITVLDWLQSLLKVSIIDQMFTVYFGLKLFF